MTEIDKTDIQRLIEAPQEPGVAQAISTFEAIEQAYFRAVAASPPAIASTHYATSTAPR